MKNNVYQTFRELVNWYLSSIVTHVFGGLVYLLALHKIVSDYINDEFVHNAYAVIFIFGCIYQILLCIYHTTMTFRNSENKTAIKNAIKEGDFTTLGYFKERYLKLTLYKVGLFTSFQFPVMICFPFFGINVQIYSMFGRFNIIEAGAYAVTGSILLGFMINLFIFGVSYFLAQIAGIYLIQKDIRENMV